MTLSQATRVFLLHLIFLMCVLLHPVTTLPSTRVVYYLHTVPATWREASSLCQSYGAVLLTLPDFTATNNSLHYVNLHSWGSQLDSLQDGFWTGLYRNSTNALRWQKCTDYDASVVPPEVTLSPVESCYVSDSSLRLTPLVCSATRPYICQRDDGQCWFQPYVDTAIEDGDAASSHTNVTTASDEGECAELCRSAVEQGRECWGFTFKDPQCRLQFTDHAHRYALHPGALYFLSASGHTAYVKICTGGWTTTLTPTVQDAAATAQDENCTVTTLHDWDNLVCYCECDRPPVILEAESLVMTIDEKVEKIVKELQVNPDNTSSTRRKKVSAEDSRPSAQGIGYFGVGFLAVIFGGIFLLDLNVLYAHAAELCRRLKAKGQSDC